MSLTDLLKLTIIFFLTLLATEGGYSPKCAATTPYGFQRNSLSAERHTYRQTTGAKAFEFQWEGIIASTVSIKTVSPEETHENICRPSGETLRWSLQTADGTITAFRKNDNICVQGDRRNKPVDTCHPIGQDHWFQPLSWALRQLVLGDTSTIEFWMMRPDKLKPIKLKATREDTGTIEVGDRNVEASRVRLTLTGLKENWWQSHYWFRQSDGVFLRYEGVNGLPGTPTTVIQLIE